MYVTFDFERCYKKSNKSSDLIGLTNKRSNMTHGILFSWWSDWCQMQPHLTAKNMATPILCCDECGKTLKTFQALLKHFAQRHINKPLPRRAAFMEGDQEIKKLEPQAIRSSPVLAEYKLWLVGVTKRVNGVHHQRHKSKF